MKEIVRLLSAHGIRFEAGLSRGEIRAVEDRFEFTFPTDLRAFLEYALPTGKEFPDWRHPSVPELRKQMDWPAEGVLFDVRESEFWLESWGARPASLETALDTASTFLRAAPKLVPILSHRYMCEQPRTAGSPVISVWQTDVIYYGSDLADYFAREFASSTRLSERPFATEPAKIPFWSEIIDLPLL